MLICLVKGGYRANFIVRMKQCELHCYVIGENGCKLRREYFESSLDDGFGNCGNYGHQLCAYGECTGWHNRGWSNGDDGVCRPDIL
jgi:hypothetical protein